MGNFLGVRQFFLPWRKHQIERKPSHLMRFIWIALALLTLSSAALALSEDEKQGLSRILNEIPLLSNMSSPWSQNVSLACDTPGFYGITCSDGPDPHVIGMYGPNKSFPNFQDKMRR